MCKLIDLTFHIFHAFMFMSLIAILIANIIFLFGFHFCQTIYSLLKGYKIKSRRSRFCENFNDSCTWNDFRNMKLSKFHLRYYPPGIILEYIQAGITKRKTVDLLDLLPSSNVEVVADELLEKEQLITPNVIDQLKKCLETLRKNLESDAGTGKRFYIYKTLQTHLLPLTNVAFHKQGKQCLSGSYDRTCKIWNVDTGEDEHTLTGHNNVVYSVGYNYPTCNRVITGSFDKTAKLWDPSTGECVFTLYGHQAEVVCAQFCPDGDFIATASMDHTSRIFDSTTGQEVFPLIAHTAEVIALDFNSTTSQELITGSFDHTISIWDLREGGRVAVLVGHEAEISNCLYDWSCHLVASSSFDNTARVWDVRTRRCLATISSHTDEVLDVSFDYSGKQLATGSLDCSARIFDVKTDFRELKIMVGHAEEVSKVCFSPGGNTLLTASADMTARLWNCDSGNCTQVLSGHRGEVFSCAFSYLGDTLVTASKDNTCRVWR